VQHHLDVAGFGPGLGDQARLRGLGKLGPLDHLLHDLSDVGDNLQGRSLLEELLVGVSTVGLLELDDCGGRLGILIRQIRCEFLLH
jgi:hypothetical protein